MTGQRGETWLLVAGMVVGATLAAVGVAGGSGSAGAGVGGEAVIDDVEYERALRAVAAGRREPLGPGEARHVLERLVDEELLVRHGLAIGLAERDPRVRAELSAAVLGLVVERGEADAEAASEAALRAFYATHVERFRRPDAWRLTAVFVAGSGAAARARAEALRGRLVAGEAAEAVHAGADAPIAPLPAGWVLDETVREYLGPTVASALAGLEDGEVSEVSEGGGGFQVVRVEARRRGRVAGFEEVEGEVRAAYRVWTGDEALRRFLSERRRGLEVVVR